MISYRPEPLCRGKFDERPTQLSSNDGGAADNTGWYEASDFQALVAAVGGATTQLLNMIHGILPGSESDEVLISVKSADVDVLSRIVDELELLIPDSAAINVVVRPTCVNPELAESLKVYLSDIAVGTPNVRLVDPLTGQLVIRGPVEAHQRIAEALGSYEDFAELEPELQSKVVRYVEGPRPRRL